MIARFVLLSIPRNIGMWIRLNVLTAYWTMIAIILQW
jgi:hypothetical protein